MGGSLDRVRHLNPSSNARHSSLTCEEHYHRPRASAIRCPQNRLLRIPSANLMRRIQRSIDPSPPILTAVLQYREFELEGFPISIENDVPQYSFVFQFPTDGNTVRKGRPVRLIELHPVPGVFLFAENLA